MQSIFGISQTYLALESFKDIFTMRYFKYTEKYRGQSYHHFNYLYSTLLDIVSPVDRTFQPRLFIARVITESSVPHAPPRTRQLSVFVEVSEWRKASVLSS